MSLPNRPSLQQPTYSTVLSPAASGLGCQQANPKQTCSQPNREIAVHSGSNQTLPSSSYKDSSRTFISIQPAQQRSRFSGIGGGFELSQLVYSNVPRSASREYFQTYQPRRSCLNDLNHPPLSEYLIDFPSKSIDCHFTFCILSGVCKNFDNITPPDSFDNTVSQDFRV